MARLLAGLLLVAAGHTGVATELETSLEATVQVDAGGFPLKEVPSVAMLFQIRRQITTSTIWERWYRDAFDWIYAQGLEDPQVTPRENSTILRSFTNYSPAFRPDAVAEFLPPTLKDSLIPGPTECVWDNLTPCNYRLFLEAYTEFPEAQFFILVSHNSMPLKPFSHIFEALKKDRRIRTTLVRYDFASALPKSSTWRGEPREVVEGRVWDADWTGGTWLHSDRGICGPDECLIWKPLVRQYGAEFTKKFALSECQDHMACFMFDCWGDMKECTNAGESEKKIPFDWDLMDEDWLKGQLDNPDRWFLRKVKDFTPVGKKKKIPMVEFLGDYFQSHYNDLYVPEHPYANETVPRLTHVTIYELHAAYKAANLYGLRDGL